jgi:hypothetical protein
MRSFTSARLTELLAPHQPPCISVYLPTERTYPDRHQSPVRYRNLVDQAEALLRRQYPGREVRALLEKFNALADDSVFWRQRVAGLAVLGSADVFETFDLERAVPERVVVADNFHLKPLLRVLQSADRFQVLCLTRAGVRMFEGDRDVLNEIDLRGVPANVTEALGEPVPGPGRIRTPARTGPGSLRSQGEYDEAKLEGEKFFRIVDKAVWERHSRPSRLPLLLAALAEHQSAFRAISHNPQLLPEGIERNPDETMSAEQLREEAWRLVLPRYRERLARLVDDFQVARARQKGSDDLARVAEAACRGRVGTLLIDADRQVFGTIDRSNCRVQLVDGPAGVDDLLNEVGEQVLKTDGTVVVVPSDQMPTTTGLAAVFRY